MFSFSDGESKPLAVAPCVRLNRLFGSKIVQFQPLTFSREGLSASYIDFNHYLLHYHGSQSRHNHMLYALDRNSWKSTNLHSTASEIDVLKLILYDFCQGSVLLVLHQCISNCIFNRSPISFFSSKLVFCMLCSKFQFHN